MTNSSSQAPAPATTAAFHIQAVLSFGVSLAAVVVGVLYLPADPWVKAFLAIGVLYVDDVGVHAGEDRAGPQDSLAVVSRVDQARMDKLLAEHDPFKNVA